MTATAAKKTDFQFLAGIIIVIAAFCLWRGGFINFGQIFSASAAALCPVTDGGAGDDDSVANGTITVSTTQTWTALSADYWNCTGKDIRVTATGTLNLQGSTTLGYIPQIYTDNLTVDWNGKSVPIEFFKELVLLDTKHRGFPFGVEVINNERKAIHKRYGLPEDVLIVHY